MFFENICTLSTMYKTRRHVSRTYSSFYGNIFLLISILYFSRRSFLSNKTSRKMSNMFYSLTLLSIAYLIEYCVITGWRYSHLRAGSGSLHQPGTFCPGSSSAARGGTRTCSLTPWHPHEWPYDPCYKWVHSRNTLRCQRKTGNEWNL